MEDNDDQTPPHQQAILDELDEIYGRATDWKVDIERTQRIFHNLDAEKMEFSETSIAAMLKQIASKYNGLSDEFQVLHAVANTLLGKDDHFTLTLKHKKRGKFVSPYEFEKIHYRNQEILYYLAHLEKKGWKTEAAIAHLQVRYKLSRAAVYKAVRNAEDFIKKGNEIFSSLKEIPNPRSTNK